MNLLRLARYHAKSTDLVLCCPDNIRMSILLELLKCSVLLRCRKQLMDVRDPELQ